MYFEQDKTKPKQPQGVLTDVPGPKRNACPGTLIPQEGLVSLPARSAEDAFGLGLAYEGGRCGRERPALEGGGGPEGRRQGGNASLQHASGKDH
jgi:hypothetical protein